MCPRIELLTSIPWRHCGLIKVVSPGHEHGQASQTIRSAIPDSTEKERAGADPEFREGFQILLVSAGNRRCG